MELSNKYPEFTTMYEHVYNICQNMGMYSEELKILDQNTVRYMVDQMQEEIDSQKEQLVSQKKQLEMKNKQLEQQEKELQKLRRMLAEKEQNEKI